MITQDTIDRALKKLNEWARAYKAKGKLSDYAACEMIAKLIRDLTGR